MVNLFYSFGYDVEKVHSDIVAYPYDLWNEGERKPPGSFLTHSRGISPGGYETSMRHRRGTTSI
jgi:hypothetical protein